MQDECTDMTAKKDKKEKKIIGTVEESLAVKEIIRSSLDDRRERPSRVLVVVR